jgi:alpha-beta hydrolase superfamily lysophospholipase
MPQGSVVLAAGGLARFGTYDTAIALFRRGGFHVRMP